MTARSNMRDQGFPYIAQTVKFSSSKLELVAHGLPELIIQTD